MNLSNYLAGALLDHQSNQTVWTPPTNLFLALLDEASAASDDTTTNAGKEVNTPGTNGYDREAITLGAHSARIASNTNIITFGPATANWTAAGWGWIVDALTGGNILWQGALAKTKTVENLDTLVFPAGSVTLTLA